MNINRINQFILGRIKIIEMVGVMMRIFSFLSTWSAGLGPKSPFLFVWAFNTSDAVILSLVFRRSKKTHGLYFSECILDPWSAIVGMFRASGILH